MAGRWLLVTAVLAAAAAGSRGVQNTPDPPWLEVRRLLDRSAFADAEPRARTLLAATEAAGATPDVARAQDLLVESLVGLGRAGATTTVALAEAAVEGKTRVAGADSLDLAVSLQNLAAVRFDRSEFTLALAAAERALAIRAARLPSGAPLQADSLDRVGETLTQLERFGPARQALERALAIREQHADSDPLSLARTLERVAWRDRFAADYRSAGAAIERARAIRRRLSIEHPDQWAVSVLLGDLAWFEGDGRKARDIWSEGAAHVELALGADHPWLVALRRRVVVADDVLGDREAAEGVMRVIAPLADRVLAPCQLDGLAVRAYAASRLAYEGDYIAARALMRRAQTAYDTCLGPLSSRAGTVTYNRALLAMRMGDYADAERLHRHTIAVWSRSLGVTHPYVARGWEGLGDVATARGDFPLAQRLYLRALTARRRAAVRNDAEIATTLMNLGRTHLALGDQARAERYIDETLTIFRGGVGGDEPDYLGRTLALRGEVLRARGDAVAARETFEAALRERERVFGVTHPLAAQSRVDVAAASFQMHDAAAALQSALAGEQAGREHLRFTIRYLPERQAMQYAASRPRGLDLALSTGAAGAGNAAPGGTSARLLDAVIRSRGVILEELAARARRTLPQNADTAPLLARAAAARQRYANLVVRTLQQSAPRAPHEGLPRTQLDEARAEKEEAEQALAEQSAAGGLEIVRSDAGLDAVRAALSADAAMVSFVRYERTTVVSSGASSGASASKAPVPSYAAFVLRPGSDPVLTPLGSAASIDALVAAWRHEASGRSLLTASRADAERAYRLAGVRLRRVVWDPLATALAGAARVFIVPDGQLNVVNFAALPTSPGRFLADESVLLHYASTERDLAMAPSGRTSGALLAVGGATFDGRTTTATDEAAARSACEAFSRLRFPALPGSRREVAEITATWPSRGTSDVTVLSGRAATETAVKRAASGRRVVHLATHGFFLGGECVPGMAGTRGVGGLAARRSAAANDADNPLLLSGLALAWANRRDKAATSEDDGILTAEEIAALNLQGTEWAVLSACDTGLGEIKAGEGVFGLRRAFQIAGARTVIMSLWSVEDNAARIWMRALYDGRFQQGLSTADAVRHASRAVLADRRAKHLSTHPFYWAGFVAAGDWR